MKKFISLILVLCVITSITRSQAKFVVSGINVDGSIPYMIVNDSGYVLDNKDSNPNQGTPAQIWQPNISESSMWLLYFNGSSIVIKNLATGLVLETRNSAKEDWAEIGLWSYVNIPTQHWFIEKDPINDKVYITNSNSNKRVSVSGGKFVNGNRIIQHGNLTVAEQWHLLPVNIHQSYYKPVSGKITCNALNVRFGPDTEFKSCGTLKKNNNISIIGRINDFYALENGGFVHCSYVNINKSNRTQIIQGMKQTILNLVDSRLNTMNNISDIGNDILINKRFLQNIGLVGGSAASGFTTAGWNVLTDPENIIALSTVTASTYFAKQAKDDANVIKSLYKKTINDASACEIMNKTISFMKNSKAVLELNKNHIDEYASLANKTKNEQIEYLTNFILEGAIDGLLGNMNNIDELADVALKIRDVSGNVKVFSETFLSITNIWNEVDKETQKIKSIFDNIK